MPRYIGTFFRFYKQMPKYIGTCFRFYTQMQVEKKAFAYRIYGHFTQQCRFELENDLEIENIIQFCFQNDSPVCGSKIGHSQSTKNSKFKI